MMTSHAIQQYLLLLSTNDLAVVKFIVLEKWQFYVFCQLFQAFIECLQHLAFQPDQESDKVSL